MASRADSPPSAIASITEHLKLLTNFLHHSAEAKAAAADPACVHVQRKLWALQLQWREPCFTRQLLHVAAVSVSHCADSQAQWHERLLPTEHNADARHILSAIIRLAKKRQVRGHEPAHPLDALHLRGPIIGSDRTNWQACPRVGVAIGDQFCLARSGGSFAKFRSHQISSSAYAQGRLVDTVLSAAGKYSWVRTREGAAGRCGVSRVFGEFHFRSRRPGEQMQDCDERAVLLRFILVILCVFALQVGCMKVSGMLSGIVRTLAYNLVDAQRAASLAIRNMCFHREYYKSAPVKPTH